MTYQSDNRDPKSLHDLYLYDEPEGLGVMDAFRFIYQKRLALALRFLMVLGLGLGTAAFWYIISLKTAQGSVELTFKGIEKSEYPSGKSFSVEDFRSPGLLSKALSEAAIPAEQVDLRQLAGNVYVTPVIPSEVQNRWKKQEQAGQKKEEYFPNEFKIAVAAQGFTDQQRIRLFDAIVNQYRSSIKSDQESALAFISAWDTSYQKMASRYDFWDIPSLFRESYTSLNRQLQDLITQSAEYKDSKYQLSFNEIAKDLHTWDMTRLQALEALTYQGRLVKNKDIVMQRVQYRLQDLDIQIRQKKQEADEAIRLLQVVNRPSAMLAGQLSGRDGLPLVDSTVLDQLIKNDYIAPVVQRISELQGDAQVMEAEKARLEKQLSWLPKSKNIDLAQLPAGYKELIDTLSSELDQVIGRYNSILDEYLTATTTSLVLISQPPVITKGGFSPLLLLVSVVFLSAFLSLFLVAVEHLFKRAREENTEPADLQHSQVVAK